ncbi:DNA mismatch repair endonuclease MutL [Candidatus Fukatsuia symbiotica]|uniref:DNA mismatch repair protein MutL n=1 Tax=Candidatus Fukatsuia symbiotica TaxID=1878942 RepID=A0A2U8I7Z6_9GAMM|nr:DNA mismatch repair endonuclease MutL [Candidatus Fukatsuia symbiotica]AWK15223.1 DNA mismatch repair protein MutL [Candidatus Fukatsuia symbiotica]MEA9444056.1 DNA mismatch repair endonuclease MutL [Candidatus Fukatsuia symbiotica]
MPIQILPPQLANQIAAGEVVERPASVVKELLENSLDAGATRIDIDIERGGTKLIRIRDNGCGIAKEELSLALARHATSKIRSLEDLETILSMGFRGEALASISSVSRLMLTSRTAKQAEAWQSYVEGRDMAVTIKPAAHPVGSTLEVLDLFYNTPARRKFMRTEKTEFGHIDEVVRRIALARFDVTINLGHNDKLIRQYRSALDPSQYERRLASICGAAFLQHALAISWQHGDLAIGGWVVDPAVKRSLNEIQYCYVNKRMMRDRVINHAIRQAYQDLLKDGQQPSYVLYLDLDPHQVDVNVHPAKQEVRFHQARLVHDFIYQAVTAVLQHKARQQGDLPLEVLQSGTQPVLSIDTALETPGWQPKTRVSAGLNKYAQPESLKEPHQHTDSDKLVAREQWGAVYANHHGVNRNSSCHSFGRVLSIFLPCYALIEYSDQRIALLALSVAERCLKQTQLNRLPQALRAQPLLIPLKLNLDKTEIMAYQHHKNLLSMMGIELTITQNRVTLHAVSLPLRDQNLQKLIPELLIYLSKQDKISSEVLATWIARHLSSEHKMWNVSQAIQLLTDVERLCPHLVRSPPAELLQFIDIQSTLAMLLHEQN